MTSKSIWKLTALVAIVMTAGFVIAATAFTPSAQPIGYVAQLEITNYKLTSGSEIVFKSDYQRENWSGNVYAYPVSTAGKSILRRNGGVAARHHTWMHRITIPAESL